LGLGRIFGFFALPEGLEALEFSPVIIPGAAQAGFLDVQIAGDAWDRHLWRAQFGIDRLVSAYLQFCHGAFATFG